MSNTWISTYSGKRFFPLNPNPDDIFIEDIAHALSKICRFQGHTQYDEIYSVAQHSVLVSLYVKSEHSLYGLLHDASEAYICDISSILKRTPEFEPYRKIEHNIQSMIYEKFALKPIEPEDVKIADLKILTTEVRDLMHPALLEMDFSQSAIDDLKIVPQSPKIAKQMFLDRFYQLTGNKYVR